VSIVRPGTPITAQALAEWQAQAEGVGRVCVVGGLIVNETGRLFVQKRATHRGPFPGAWDVAGGHVEQGETLRQALAREIAEETGWRLSRMVQLLDAFDWEQGTEAVREFDFVVEVDGDLDRPQIEAEKFSEYRWIGLADLDVLAENRPPEDRVVLNLARRALERAARQPF
jgi:mutator protein MutT